MPGEVVEVVHIGGQDRILPSGRRWRGSRRIGRVSHAELRRTRVLDVVHAVAVGAHRHIGVLLTQ